MKHRLLLMVLLFSAIPAIPLSAEDSDPRLDSAAVRSGFQLYREQTWGIVRARVTNPTDYVRQPLASVRLEPRENVEFMRRLWMPPRSRREALIPVFPFVVDPEANSLEAPTRLIDDTGGRTRATPWHPALLPVRDERLATVHIGDWNERGNSRGVVRALRKEQDLEHAVLLTSGSDVPTQPIAWDAVNVIAISSREPDLNALQSDALRRWLVSGGRLWVMLDQVDPDWLANVLSNSWDVSVQDRVGLHQVTIRDAEGEVRHEVESDFGIEMVRVFASDKMEVIHRIDGYPASMRRNVGKGRLLVTTVGPDAWMEGDEEALPALKDLRAFFEREELEPRNRAAIVHGAFEPFVRDQIGYSILGRGWVAGVLGGFVVVLLGSGMVLAWRGRLEMIGVTGAVVALVAAGSLIGLGMTHHGGHPLTVATGQLIYTNDEQPYVHSIGTTGIYVPATHRDDRMTITGEHGVAWPAEVGVMGSRTWLEWTDHDTWQLPRRALPPGAVHRFAGQGAYPIDEPVQAVLRFGNNGLSGAFISGPFNQFEDAVIATRRGHLAAEFDSQAPHFRAGLDALGRRQFIAGATLTDRQNRRQQVYRALAEGGLFPHEPALIGWIEGPPAKTLSLNASETREAHGLVIVPLRIEPPAPGTQITIPAALMKKYSPDATIDQQYRPGGLYNADRQEWVAPINRNATAVMQFEPPTGIGRLDVRRARLSFNLRAPGWRYQVVVIRDGRLEVVHEGSNPLGEIEIELTGEQVPPMTENGAMFAGLRIERADASGTSSWSLTRMDLSITGVALPQE